MFISTKDWVNYINKLSKLSDVAGKKMQEYVQKNGFGNTDELIEYAHALVTKYGEGSAELACQMYDAIAEMQNAAVPSAVPADMPSYGETAKAIYGSLKQSPGGNLLESVTQRLVKQSSADTMLQNAKRDGAYFAWVPSGDTCPYCLMMGGIGWQKAGKKTLEGKHAKHIHAHCDCQYIVDFKGNMKISGYNPDKIRKKILKVTGNDEYTTDYAFDAFLNENARKSTAGNRDGINAIRRMQYESNKDAINSRKRELYKSSDNHLLTTYNKVIAKEPLITKDMKEVARLNSVEMYGLEHRIKTKESYLEKVKKNESDYEVKDIIRYTFGTENPDNYVENVNKIIDSLKEKGYNIYESKNYWLDDSPYKGLNTTIIERDGQKFEVQFHTKESYAAKEATHKYYEIQRKLTDKHSAEYIEITDKMYDISDTVKVPKGIDKI